MSKFLLAFPIAALLYGNCVCGMDSDESELYENPWNNTDIENNKKFETQTNKRKLTPLPKNLSYENPASSLDQQQNEIRYYALSEQLAEYKRVLQKLGEQLKKEIEKNKLYETRIQNQQAQIEELLKILKADNKVKSKLYTIEETQENVENMSFNPKQKESLLEAIASNNLSKVKYVTKNGANVNEQYKDGSNPLLQAVSQGNLDIVTHLVEQGAEINEGTSNGITPLYTASRNGYENIVKYLVEHGADINKGMDNKTTPLYIASRNGHENIVKYLVENGADINKENSEGITPLSIAKYKNHKNIVEYLEKCNADAISKENKNEITHLPATKSKKENVVLTDPQKSNYIQLLRPIIYLM